MKLHNEIQENYLPKLPSRKQKGHADLTENHHPSTQAPRFPFCPHSSPILARVAIRYRPLTPPNYLYPTCPLTSLPVTIFTEQTNSHTPSYLFPIFDSFFLEKIETMYNECVSPSFKQKIKSSMCCFGGSPHTKLRALDSEDDDVLKQHQPRSPRWGIFSMIGSKNRRRPNSADFRYDPLSYSLNFEDEMRRDDADELRVNFSSRLRASPSPSQVAPIVSREILACL